MLSPYVETLHTDTKKLKLKEDIYLTSHSQQVMDLKL